MAYGAFLFQNGNPMKGRGSVKKLFGGLLLVAGILLISYPFYQEWKQGKELRALEEALSLISGADGEDVDLSAIGDLSLSKDQIENVMELEIPFIDLKQFILEETTDENLNLALTQIKKDQIPGVGNFTIAGHRGYRDGRHFSKLSKVPVGEMVYLHTDDETYVYELKSSEVIEATDVEVLNDVKGKDGITLITCTVSGASRVAVKGDLVKTITK